ncbi:MAG: hypothetical protein ACP5R4_14545, partial [Armatimonadota bacterium]
PVGRLSDFAAWRFWTGGRWTKDWKAASPLPVRDIGTEFSVSYLASLRRYVLVYSPSDLAPVIKVRWTDKPIGPWSDALTAYRCPDAAVGREVFCYAAKGHPELSSEGELLVTYATNSFQLKEVLENSQLYFPRFVRLKFFRRQEALPTTPSDKRKAPLTHTSEQGALQELHTARGEKAGTQQPRLLHPHALRTQNAFHRLHQLRGVRNPHPR